MVMNCFDIESCVNAFLGPSSGLLQKEDEQEEKEVFLAGKAENHTSSQAQDTEAQCGWEESAGVFLQLPLGSGGHCHATSTVSSAHALG